MISTSAAVPMTDVFVAERFLRSLWADTPGYLALSHARPTTPGGKRPRLNTDWFPTGDYAAAARRGAELCPHLHVWIAAGLHAKPQPAGKRGGNDDVVAIPGLWADVDYSHPVHKKAEHLPPGLDAAVGLVRTVPLRPTFLVDSGHGAQAWWLFPRPLLLDTPDSRACAIDLLNRLKQHLSSAAADHGWKVDAVADLARVMRLPGLINIKSEPVPVTILEEDDAARYEPAEFDRVLPALAIATPVVTADPAPRIPADASDELLLRKAMNARNGTAFTQLWRGDSSMHGDDVSRADQALANLLAFWAGPDASRIDTLFRQSGRMRPKWDEKHYADGRTYGRGTIDKAIKDCRQFYDWLRWYGDEVFGSALQRQSRAQRRSLRPTLTIAPLRCGGGR